jgi:hypothetical protein
VLLTCRRFALRILISLTWMVRIRAMTNSIGARREKIRDVVFLNIANLNIRAPKPKRVWVLRWIGYRAKRNARRPAAEPPQDGPSNVIYLSWDQTFGRP